jgi:hypothetical protein
MVTSEDYWSKINQMLSSEWEIPSNTMGKSLECGNLHASFTLFEVFEIQPNFLIPQKLDSRSDNWGFKLHSVPTY